MSRRCLNLILSLASLVACKPQATEKSDIKSAYYDGVEWPNPQAIPVCFVNRGDVDPQIPSDLRNAIEEEYHRKTAIRFVGWGDCKTEDFRVDVISIYFMKSKVWTGDYVTYGGGHSRLGVYPLRSCELPKYKDDDRCHFINIEVGAEGRYPDNGYRDVIISWTRGQFVHEFRHSIGLAHEHYRSDGSNCDKDASFTATNGAVLNDATVLTKPAKIVFAGTYDPESIMNYCAKTSAFHDGYYGLSAGDIAGIDFLYPPPLPAATNGAFRLYAAAVERCLQSNAGKIELAKCAVSDAQLFNTLFNGDGSFFLQNKKTTACMDSSNLSAKGNLVEKPCQSTMTQRFYLTPASASLTYTLRFAALPSKCANARLVPLTLSTETYSDTCGADSNFQVIGAQEALNARK